MIQIKFEKNFKKYGLVILVWEIFLQSRYAKITIQHRPCAGYDMCTAYENGVRNNLLIIEMAIRKRVPFLFLRTIHRKAIKFSATKTTAFATGILKSTAEVMCAFPSGMVGSTIQKIIEATSAIIVMAIRINRICVAGFSWCN